MFGRRRATAEELAQCEKEMEEAQKRVDREIAQSEEIGPESAESFDSPKTSGNPEAFASSSAWAGKC